MFESCWAHHSTRLHLADGETKTRSWRAIRLVECPERAERVEGPHLAVPLISTSIQAIDDDIVVACGSSTYCAVLTNRSTSAKHTTSPNASQLTTKVVPRRTRRNARLCDRSSEP